MPKHLIRRYLPDPKKIKEVKSLRLLGSRIYDPNLWHLNRRSVSLAFFVGVFFAFMPIPMQMLAASLVALGIRCNMPISVALVWITNPLTIPPIFYFNYRVGLLLLRNQDEAVHLRWSLEGIQQQLHHIWQPLLLGSLAAGLVAASLAYLAIRIYWRWHVVQSWKARMRKKA